MSKRPPAPLKESALHKCSGDGGASPVAATVTACLLHAGLFAGVLYLANASPSQASKLLAPLTMLEVELAPPPPEAPAPEPEAPTEPPKAEPKASKAPPQPVLPAEPPPEPEKPAEPEPPAPAAAQAAEAITAKDEAPQADPANTLVTGTGSQYAGGTTERGGTATHAVAASTARAFGVEGGAGSAQPDRSRAPQLAAGNRWDCPLPEDALDEGVEHAVVGLLVEVAHDGSLAAIEVKSDPGYGFAREARACALKKKWIPGLDRNGQPLKVKQLVNVKF